MGRNEAGGTNPDRRTEGPVGDRPYFAIWTA